MKEYTDDDNTNSTSRNSQNTSPHSKNGSQDSHASNENLYYNSGTNNYNNKSAVTTSATSTFTPLDLEEQKHRAAIVRSAQGYPCVYCNGFESKYQEDYERHIITKHPDHLPCPTDEELDLNGGRIKRGRK